MFPVVAVVVKLVWIPAVLVSADIRTEIVNEMGPITCVSLAIFISAFTGSFSLPRLSGKNSSRTKGKAVWALEEFFIRLRYRWRRESHCVSSWLPR